MNEITDSTFEPETFNFAPQKILGWHFSNNAKLRYNDKRPIVVGETLSVKGDIIPCVNGLHASEKAFDAFQYVRGKYLWRVELEGDLLSNGNPIDKWVGRHRKVLAGGDATQMLQKFGRDCALEVTHLLPEAPPEEVKTFLKTGVITDFVKNYFNYNNVNINVAAYYAVFYAYCACKTNDISYVYNTISVTTEALNINIKTYTNKFEEACLKFINEKS